VVCEYSILKKIIYVALPLAVAVAIFLTYWLFYSSNYTDAYLQSS
jgi:hypothetical protein